MIKVRLRPCIVGGQRALFHRWIEKITPIIKIQMRLPQKELAARIKTVKESIVLIGGKPFLVKTNNPKIVGVVVVCEGADDVSVKLSVVEIITTTLSINADKVRIIKMK